MSLKNPQNAFKRNRPTFHTLGLGGSQSFSCAGIGPNLLPRLRATFAHSAYSKGCVPGLSSNSLGRDRVGSSGVSSIP